MAGSSTLGAGSASTPPGGAPRALGRSPAVHGDGVVARLLLLLLHGRDEVDHAFALGRDPDLGPAVEVELADHAGLLLLVGQGLQAGEGISAHTTPTTQDPAPSPPTLPRPRAQARGPPGAFTAGTVPVWLA